MSEGNNILMNTLMKAAMPTVEKIVGSGKIDGLLRELKDSFHDRAPEGCSCEILVSSEDDGCEYLNIVTLSADMHIESVLYQKKLSESIVELLNQSKNATRNTK